MNRQNDKTLQDMEAVSIQWFPGHMTRTKRQIEKSIDWWMPLREIVDARVPNSSRNPFFTN